jgi:FMN phosphatase YigB (HAD superfamily)
MVYIDDMYKSPVGEFGRMKMSHMIADSTEELIEMAVKIGVNKKWIQNPGTQREHFDICLSKRKKAIEFGAKEISWKELGEMILSRHKE